MAGVWRQPDQLALVDQQAAGGHRRPAGQERAVVEAALLLVAAVERLVWVHDVDQQVHLALLDLPRAGDHAGGVGLAALAALRGLRQLGLREVRPVPARVAAPMAQRSEHGVRSAPG